MTLLPLGVPRASGGGYLCPKEPTKTKKEHGILNKKVVNHCSHSDDAIDDVKQSITEKRVKNSGHNAKAPSTKTVLNNAFAAVVLDENVCEVNKNSLIDLILFLRAVDFIQKHLFTVYYFFIKLMILFVSASLTIKVPFSFGCMPSS